MVRPLATRLNTLFWYLPLPLDRVLTLLSKVYNEENKKWFKPILFFLDSLVF